MENFLEILDSILILVKSRKPSCYVVRNGPVSDLYGVPSLIVFKTCNGFKASVVFRSIYADFDWKDLPAVAKNLDWYTVRGAQHLYTFDNSNSAEDDVKKFIDNALGLMQDVKTLEVIAF